MNFIGPILSLSIALNVYLGLELQRQKRISRAFEESSNIFRDL